MSKLTEVFWDAWSEASLIPGWLTMAEAWSLYRTATLVSREKSILEIGSFNGRSTRILASTGRQIFCVDPFEEGYDLGYRIAGRDEVIIGEGDYNNFKRNILDRFDNVSLIRKRSTDVDTSGLDLGMLFIDGNHKDGWPLKDFMHYQPVLGRFVALHDVTVFRDVKAAVHIAMDYDYKMHPLSAESLWVGDNGA